MGDNGNGKSSIIDAITTALFFRARGTDSRGAGMDDLISYNAKEFEIQYIYEMDNHRYEIIRSKVRNGTHKLSFFIDSADHSSSLKDTQNKIIECLHTDFDTFCDTVLITQNTSSSFMDKTPDKRKETFVQILRLDEYDILANFTKTLKKDINNELINKKNRLQSLDAFINHKDEYLLQQKQFIDEYNNIDTSDLEKQILELSNKFNNYDTLKSKNDLVLKTRNRLQEQISLLNNDISRQQDELDSFTIDAIDTVEDNTKTIQDEIDTLQNQLYDLNSKLSVYKNELNIKKKKINDLKQYDKSVCEFCGNIITEEHKQKHIDELQNSGNKIFNLAKNVKANIDAINEQAVLLKKKYQENVNEINKVKQLMHNIDIQKLKKKNLEETLENNKKLIKQLQDELDKNMQEIIEELPTIGSRNQLDILKNQLQVKKDRKNKLKENLAILKDRLSQINEFEEEYNELTESVSLLEEKLNDYNAIIHAFGKNGIQSYIIENALPEIENEINLLLSELANNISIKFITTKESKTKTTIDTLDIIVSDGNIERKYETFSGGEKFRIDFASHVGLARFLAKRSNSALGFFILDEHLGSQDETARSVFIQCISKMTKYFEQIMIITHINDIKEAFNNCIEVIKDDNGSHVIYKLNKG